MSDRPAEDAAVSVARRLRSAIGRRGSATLAMSGGSTAPALIGALLATGLPWEAVTVWQVDERIAPDGDPDRNAGQLDDLPCRVRLMPVTAAGIGAAARRYGASLPERFDVVHLGLGDDGHTASWPPGDPVVESDRAVEVVDEFNGRRRMTLTPPVVNGARSRIVLATGAGKAEMVERWSRGDPSLPIARVHRTATTAFLDPAAAARLRR